MKTKHTPGPWKAVGDVIIREDSYTANEWIAEVVSTGKPAKEIIANIKVIETAPELLEACQSVMRCERGVHLPAEVVVKLGNAIQKATS